MKTIIILFSLFLSASISFSFDNDPQAIALRPGTNELFIGGEFSQIIVIDATSGEHVRQISVPEKAMELTFTKDGSKLLVSDDDQVLYINPDNGEVLQTLSIRGAHLFPNAPYFVSYLWYMNKTITVYDVEDASPLYSFESPNEIESAGFNSDFTELLIFGRSMDISSESKLIHKKVEKREDYDPFNQTLVEQQNDGKGSGFTVISIPENKIKLDVILPYTPSSSFAFNLSKYQEDYFAIGFDLLIKITKDGLAFPIELANSSFVYAAGNSPDQKIIYFGAMGDLNTYDCSTGAHFKMDMGEAESSYAAAYCTTSDKVYALNQALQVHVTNAKAVKQKTLEAKMKSDSGFGVYYTNGFAKKEARDKEASIINNVLAELGLPQIDLESSIGDSNFLLGVFQSQEEAEAFQQRIDDDGLQYITKVKVYEE